MLYGHTVLTRHVISLGDCACRRAQEQARLVASSGNDSCMNMVMTQVPRVPKLGGQTSTNRLSPSRSESFTSSQRAVVMQQTIMHGVHCVLVWTDRCKHTLKAANQPMPCQHAPELQPQAHKHTQLWNLTDSHAHVTAHSDGGCH